MRKKEKILIIGGSSFIGSYLILSLKKYFQLTFTYHNTKVEFSNKVENLKFNFRNNLSLEKFANFDVIIHLATQKKLLKNKNHLNFEKIFLEKITGYCKKKNIKFIYISTSLIYKNKHHNDENSIKISSHRNQYIKSKIIFDRIIENKIEFGLKALMLRIPSIYSSELDKISLIKSHKEKLKNNETINYYKSSSNSIRFIYLSDLSKIIKKSIKLDIDGIYNLESGENIKIIEIIENLKKKLRSNSKIKIIKRNINSVNYPILNIEKIKKKFDFEPQKKFIFFLKKIK
tara:strand:- start:5720 stop:6583 length:864 start_codon:yes stop_codon:yes gene_type:complete